MGLVGFALGFVVANGWDGAFPTHRNLGIAATVFGLLQARVQRSAAAMLCCAVLCCSSHAVLRWRDGAGRSRAAHCAAPQAGAAWAQQQGDLSAGHGRRDCAATCPPVLPQPAAMPPPLSNPTGARPPRLLPSLPPSLQLSALLRPKLSSPLRRKWNLVHWWFGRAAVVLAVADIYYGLANMVNTGSWGWGAYTAVIGSIVAFAILKER